MSSYYSDKIYKGIENIAIAMDIGTTQTAVSFVHFSPGSKPQAKMVAHWPGLGPWNATAKIPSILSYRNGIVNVCGVPAVQELDEHPENVAYWFKLHLHPASITQSNPLEFKIPPLPLGVTIEQVYADIMQYLMKNTQRFFEDTNVDGIMIWKRLRDNITIILATPNGWDIREQAILRKAAIRASLFTEEKSKHLLQFMTESEASVHYAIAKQEGKWLKKDTKFVVMDCGGSTVDTTIYRSLSISPLMLQEECPSECIQAGGIFVNHEVTRMLEEKFKGSPKFSHPAFIKNITDAFESQVKPKFDGEIETYDIKFGFTQDDEDPKLGIHKNKIILFNRDLKPVFDRVIDRISANCLKILANQKSKYVLLVGGFAESPYVRKVISNIAPDGVQVITVGDYAKKAAAEGAIIGHIKHFVVSRAARATFGGCVRPVYDKRLHHERKHTAQVYPDGKKRVDGGFHAWIKKGRILQDNFVYKLPYHVAWDATITSESDLIRELGGIEIEVFAWEGDNIPMWCKDEHGTVLNEMRHICTLSADLSALARGLPTRSGLQGRKFYRVDYNVYIYFGGTQLRAQLQWKGKEAFHENEIKVIPHILK